jgi:radical SAM superfamily enzyme YgiQ (UPF0313 family)
MLIYFINPPFKSEYGRFSRESRSPAITKSGALYYPLWLMYAAAYVKRSGHTVFFLDAPAKRLDDKQVLDIIKRQIDGRILFVLDTSTPSIKSDVKFGVQLRNNFSNSFVLLVGTHPSACPEETLLFDSAIDAIARGEYDLIVKDLADALDINSGLEGVRGLTYRDSNTGIIKKTKNMPYLKNLDELPYAAEFIKSYLDAKDYFFPPATYPAIQIFTGRGCPFHCNFCVYPQTMHGHKYRIRSAESIVDEFKYVADNFSNVKEVVIEDDTFTTDKIHVMEICNLLIKNGLPNRLKWLCNARVNLDLETMKIMKRAGCRLIIPGIETGNQQILNNIKKGTRIEQFEAYVKNAKKAGLLIHACYMVGNQGETPQTMQETLELALRLNTDTVQFFPLIPYPGTEAYIWAKQKGYIETDYEKYCKPDGTHNTVLNLPDLSAEDMLNFCDRARKKYYLRPRYFFHRLRIGLTNINDLKRSLKAFKYLKDYLFRR